MVRTHSRYKIMPYINGFKRFSTIKLKRKSQQYIQQPNTRDFLWKALVSYLSSSIQKKPLWILLFVKTRKELVIPAHSVENQNGYWIVPLIERMSRQPCNIYHCGAKEAINNVFPCGPFFSLLYRTNPGLQIYELWIKFTPADKASVKTHLLLLPYFEGLNSCIISSAQDHVSSNRYCLPLSKSWVQASKFHC